MESILAPPASGQSVTQSLAMGLVLHLRNQKREDAMIVIENRPRRVEVTVYAEFTLADYQEFENAVNYVIQFEGQVDLFFDLR